MQLINILIFIPWFTPAYRAGGPIQSIANMLEQLYLDYDFSVFTSNADIDGKKTGVKADEWINYKRGIKVYYADNVSSETLDRNFKMADPQVVFINGIYSMPFTFLPLKFRKKVRTIISARGMLHPGALSQKSLKKKIYLALLKMIGIHKTCEFHASTEEEKEYIKAVFGKKAIVHVANNFPRIFDRKPLPKKVLKHLELISIALISPMKNHLAVLQALIHATDHINYTIYGPVKEQRYWDDCLEAIKRLPPNVTVKYKGEIEPAEVEHALSSAHVCILPSKSENFGHSIYEALSAGRPVITSHATPWKELEKNSAGMNIDPMDPKALLEAINYFSEMDAEKLQAWSLSAKEYAKRAINTDQIREEYHKMFRC